MIRFYQPLEQFEIFLLDFSDLYFIFVNFPSSIWSFFVVIGVILLICKICLLKIFYLPTLIQYILEVVYKFINELVMEQTNKKGGNYFSFIFTLFFFILISNFIGLVPFGFTLTSHILITFSLGFSIILGLTIIGFLVQGIYFLKLFVPKDVNFLMVPLLIIIEVVSYVSRGFSLAIRLFANIMSGHTLLNILSSFIFMLINVNKLLMLITFLVVFAISFLEIALAFLQAYVFTVLTCIYLNDSLNLSDH